MHCIPHRVVTSDDDIWGPELASAGPKTFCPCYNEKSWAELAGVGDRIKVAQ